MDMQLELRSAIEETKLKETVTASKSNEIATSTNVKYGY